MGSRDHSETCDVCGFERGGMNDLECACEYVDSRRADRLALSELGRQLAVAAGLERAYRLGWDPPSIVDGILYMRWKPGCGRQAP